MSDAPRQVTIESLCKLEKENGELERLLQIERAAKEQAEARLAEALRWVKLLNDYAAAPTACAPDEEIAPAAVLWDQIAKSQGELEDFLASSTPPPIVAELERLRAEIGAHQSHLAKREIVLNAAEKERDDLREGFDALVKGAIAAKEKSNTERDELRAKLQVAREALVIVKDTTSHYTESGTCVSVCRTTATQALAQLDAEKGKANE